VLPTFKSHSGPILGFTFLALGRRALSPSQHSSLWWLPVVHCRCGPVGAALGRRHRRGLSLGSGESPSPAESSRTPWLTRKPSRSATTFSHWNLRWRTKGERSWYLSWGVERLTSSSTTASPSPLLLAPVLPPLPVGTVLALASWSAWGWAPLLCKTRGECLTASEWHTARPPSLCLSPSCLLTLEAAQPLLDVWSALSAAAALSPRLEQCLQTVQSILTAVYLNSTSCPICPETAPPTPCAGGWPQVGPCPALRSSPTAWPPGPTSWRRWQCWRPLKPTCRPRGGAVCVHRRGPLHPVQVHRRSRHSSTIKVLSHPHILYWYPKKLLQQYNQSALTPLHSV